jgi:hypothetical protein
MSIYGRCDLCGIQVGDKNGYKFIEQELLPLRDFMLCGTCYRKYRKLNNIALRAKMVQS